MSIIGKILNLIGGSLITTQSFDWVLAFSRTYSVSKGGLKQGVILKYLSNRIHTLFSFVACADLGMHIAIYVVHYCLIS